MSDNTNQIDLQDLNTPVTLAEATALEDALTTPPTAEDLSDIRATPLSEATPDVFEDVAAQIVDVEDQRGPTVQFIPVSGLKAVAKGMAGNAAKTAGFAAIYTAWNSVEDLSELDTPRFVGIVIGRTVVIVALDIVALQPFNTFVHKVLGELKITRPKSLSMKVLDHLTGWTVEGALIGTFLGLMGKQGLTQNKRILGVFAGLETSFILFSLMRDMASLATALQVQHTMSDVEWKTFHVKALAAIKQRLTTQKGLEASVRLAFTVMSYPFFERAVVGNWKPAPELIPLDIVLLIGFVGLNRIGDPIAKALVALAKYCVCSARTEEEARRDE
ncbi:hypothetical protein [Agrobacterium vitis]|uniref:hypothetical protein n=1 Tax=Agrobacterium vitis TaxID=373 RepID=UPI003D28084E